MRDWRKIKRNTKRKRAGCLNRYEFAYTGRNAVNTALTTFKKVAPSLIETTTNQVDKVADKNNKTNHISGWKRIRENCPKNIKTANWWTIQNTFSFVKKFWTGKNIIRP